MALISDHFQYSGGYSEDSEQRHYRGPWQEYMRDIDPSCTLQSASGTSFWEAHKPCWWVPKRYENWHGSGPHDWAWRHDDLPRLENLLRVTDGGSTWLNMQSSVLWTKPTPADQDTLDVEQRELFLMWTGYVIRANDAEAFLEWAEEMDFYGRWMPEPVDMHTLLLGEHGWAPAARDLSRSWSDGGDGWIQPGRCCPISVRQFAYRYMSETNGYDGSVDEKFGLLLPSRDIIDGLGLRWSGKGAEYVDASGQSVAFDPSVHHSGPSALLVDEAKLRGYLAQEGLAICWAILGEKSARNPGVDLLDRVTITGACVLCGSGPVGFVALRPSVANRENCEAEKPIAKLRIPR